MISSCTDEAKARAWASLPFKEAIARCSARNVLRWVRALLNRHERLEAQLVETETFAHEQRKRAQDVEVRVSQLNDEVRRLNETEREKVLRGVAAERDDLKRQVAEYVLNGGAVVAKLRREHDADREKDHAEIRELKARVQKLERRVGGFRRIMGALRDLVD